MKIKFVNHSSFIIGHKGVSVIADPWLEGRVFNNGWELISKTRLAYEDFKDINYIWFSHEHPDHFYPPNIKKISPEHKRNITVLFQKTPDGRVANYCRKVGFKDVIEMEKGKYYDIGEDFSVLCEHFNEGDSWIDFKAGGLSVLNTNDCGIRNVPEADYIRNLVGDVDVLLTQFSYAYWVGNPDEVEYRKRKADEKLQWMKFQCDRFEPKVTIPIASYVYFCHEENVYLNDCVNTAEKTYNFLLKETRTEPVVLYNGDEYEFKQKWDSQKAIGQYKNDFTKALNAKENLAKNNPVELKELTEQAEKFINNLVNTNNSIVKLALRDVKIFLWDYGKAFVLSLKNGFREIGEREENCDVAMSSESLLFCLKFPYGTDTVQISGRMQKPPNGNYTRFYNLFRIDQQKSRGQEMTVGYLANVALGKVLVKLGFKNV